VTGIQPERGDSPLLLDFPFGGVRGVSVTIHGPYDRAPMISGLKKVIDIGEGLMEIETSGGGPTS
jgi:hypothetical protein